MKELRTMMAKAIAEEMIPSFTKEEIKALQAKTHIPPTNVGGKGSVVNAVDGVILESEKKAASDERFAITMEHNEDGTKTPVKVELVKKNPKCPSIALAYLPYLGGRNAVANDGYHAQEEYDAVPHPTAEITRVTTDYIPPMYVWILSAFRLRFYRCGILTIRWTMEEKLLALYLHEVYHFTYKHIGEILGRSTSGVASAFYYMRIKGLTSIAELPKRRRWTDMEEKYLIKLMQEGVKQVDIAKLVGRSVGSVGTKVRQLRKDGVL